jgi:hypothetical protein
MSRPEPAVGEVARGVSLFCDVLRGSALRCEVLGSRRVASRLGPRPVAARHTAYRFGVRLMWAAAAARGAGPGAAFAPRLGPAVGEGACGVLLFCDVLRGSAPRRVWECLGLGTRGVGPGTAVGGCALQGVSLRRALEARGCGCMRDGFGSGLGCRARNRRSERWRAGCRYSTTYFAARLSAARSWDRDAWRHAWDRGRWLHATRRIASACV